MTSIDSSTPPYLHAEDRSMGRRRLLILPLMMVLAACGTESVLPETDGFGAAPNLPAPKPQGVPMVKIAPAVGWPQGRAPDAAAGLAVNAFATGLDHPRWLYVLPNGDVLVAESQGPAKPKEKKGGLRGWIEGLVMARAGSGDRPSADRISLLRDADGDGAAETKTVFLSGLTSPFGMALVAETLYVANADALVKVPIGRDRRASRRRRSRSRTCPPGATTTGPRASSPRPTGRNCMSGSAPTPTSAKTGWMRRSTAPP